MTIFFQDELSGAAQSIVVVLVVVFILLLLLSLTLELSIQISLANESKSLLSPPTREAGARTAASCLVAAALQSQSRLGGVVEQRQKGSGVNENTLPGLFLWDLAACENRLTPPGQCSGGIFDLSSR
ncbi:hypothetical protein PHYPO_G00018130 [Pangasianodon hypophthalmus]|uniref:Uncharacterized protein n=1 Tax=Pangasianodon hypophthalmus TaxID=310915 RepID=A0A5N5N6Y8_PANHP|nr:hypothetical protein PHYPO_G00018130 [Pangasianodon hypophthalmus]